MGPIGSSDILKNGPISFPARKSNHGPSNPRLSYPVMTPQKYLTYWKKYYT